MNVILTTALACVKRHQEGTIPAPRSRDHLDSVTPALGVLSRTDPLAHAKSDDWRALGRCESSAA